MLGAPLWAQPTIAITSPSDGFVVHPGDSLTITVTVSPLEKFSLVAILPEDSLKAKGALVLKAPPYRFKVEIPRDTYVAGNYGIAATGALLPKGHLDCDPVVIDVERPDRPLRLKAEISALYFDSVGDGGALLIYGVFADGSELDLTHSSLTKYISGSQAIVNVDSNGLATATGVGSTTITVGNNGAKVVIPVSVLNGKAPSAGNK